MAKNYKETTTQAAVLRTSTKTLSFWCNIREAPLERFAELIEGNIRIALQDFSGGKGDKSKFAYFNLEISDIYEIKDCMQAKKSFFAQKIYGKHPETGGQFNGMCKSFHFALQYTEKAQNGELSRNPYYLCIKNGFAQAAPGQIAGSFYERKGTFQEGVAVFIRLSERDLKNLLRKVTDYIRVFQMLAGQHLIPLGLAQMENEYSQRKNGYNYNDSYTNPTDYYSPDYYNQNGQVNPSQQSYGSVGILAICTSLGTPISTYADTQDVTTNVGDKTTIKSDGSDKETTNGQEDSSDTTSGGDTTVHYTEAQLKAMDAKKKLNYELRSILTEIRKNADENGIFHSPNSSIKDIGYSYGTVDVKKDQIDQILDYLKDFESVLNKDNNRQDFDVISSVTNPIFDNMHMPKKSFSEPTIEDGGGKIALMDKNGDLSLIVSASDAPSDGLLATYEKSLQTDQENGNKGQDSESSSNAEDSTDKNTNGQNGSDSNKGDKVNVCELS